MRKSYIVNKGFVSVYGIALLSIVVCVMPLFYLKTKQYNLYLKEDSWNQVECYTIMFIKNAFLEYEEKDVSFFYQGFDIRIVYDGMLAKAEIEKDEKKLCFQITFDDVEECITSFVYVKQDEEY